jgi:hypothetical protein
MQPAGVFLSSSNFKTTIRLRPVYFAGMAELPAKTENRTRIQVADYVATMSSDLASMSRRNGLDTLGYLLEMVRLEAENVTRHTQKGSR